MDINWDAMETFSYLTHKPVLKYSEKYADWFACWLGVKMTGRQAFVIAAKLCWDARVTPEMVHNLETHFKSLYLAGVFCNDSWDHIVKEKQVTITQLHKIESQMHKQHVTLDNTEVFSWFDNMLKTQ